MLDQTIEDLTRQYVRFNFGVSSQWNKTYCEVCGDGSRTKGPRGGWLFSDEMAFYHCFNCGIDGSFDPNREYPFSKDMRRIFDAFGIPSNEYNVVAYKNKVLENNKVRKPVKKKIEQIPIPIPDYFYKLSDASESNIIAKSALRELKYRNIDPNDYTFYLSTGKSNGNPRDNAIAKALMNRLIIPFYNNDGEMIYYQARALGKDMKKRYINADVPRSNVIYGMDQLYNRISSPLYVCEGFFDAYHLKGVSVQENSITQSQIELLKHSPRKKIFVPDKNSDSSKMVDQFAKLDWFVSVPNIGSLCKDVDDAIRKYGKLYTLQEVASNVYPAKDSKIILKMNGFL